MTHSAALSADALPCLSEEDALAFAGGRLSEERRERVHLHLDACDECQLLLTEAVHALATSRSLGEARDPVAWSTTFRPGALVGRYLIRRFIARGGMGEVYEAFDQELQERVALKTVTSTASDDPSAVRRLKAEVQLARRVSHPNVCRIYDFGTHRATGLPSISFLTMEFVEGETLGLRLREHGALSVAESVALGRALLRGLDAAHSAGVLHRDFKSDNVILRRDGQRAEPLILDFGLARALDQVGHTSSNSGRGLVGTLAYMAPEQLEGQSFTTASDIYSFGLVWFEMLTGELPFQGRSSPTVTTLERLTKPVPAPSTKNPLVPPALDGLVLACLRRHARDRPQTAAEVLARLEALDSGERRKPRAWTNLRALAGVAVVGASVASITSALLHEPRREPPPGVSETIRAARSAAPVLPIAEPAPTPASPPPSSHAVSAAPDVALSATSAPCCCSGRRVRITCSAAWWSAGTA